MKLRIIMILAALLFTVGCGADDDGSVEFNETTSELSVSTVIDGRLRYTYVYYPIHLPPEQASRVTNQIMQIYSSTSAEMPGRIDLYDVDEDMEAHEPTVDSLVTDICIRNGVARAGVCGRLSQFEPGPPEHPTPHDDNPEPEEDDESEADQ